ncbi:hypothetical protein Tco_0080875, partial [Tanacetum coccineum]
LSNDPLLVGVNTPRSGENSLKLEELMALCITLQQRVLDLENTMTTQAQEITTSLGDQEDASKQRRIADIDADAAINLVVVETKVASKDVNLSVNEVTLAQALAALKSAKPKADKVMLHEPAQGTITTTTATSTRPKAKGLDKGKGKMVEPELVKKLSKKDQLMLDEELAFKIQAEEEEEERFAREKAQQIEEANIVSWDNVQAMIDADYQMAQQMQAEEQEKLSIKEKSKLFVQLVEARKKHFPAMRA